MSISWKTCEVMSFLRISLLWQYFDSRCFMSAIFKPLPGEGSTTVEGMLLLHRSNVPWVLTLAASQRLGRIRARISADNSPTFTHWLCFSRCLLSRIARQLMFINATKNATLLQFLVGGWHPVTPIRRYRFHRPIFIRATLSSYFLISSV